MLHGQRVFRCGLPHARRHVVLVVARVSAVAVRRARGVISVTAVLMAAVLLGLGVFVPPLVRVDLVDALPGRHRAVVAVLLFFFFQGILNVIVGGLWRRFEQLLAEGAPLVGVCLFHVEGFDDEVHEPFAVLAVRFLLTEEVGDDATEGCLAVE